MSKMPLETPKASESSVLSALKSLNKLITLAPQKRVFQWVVVAAAALTVVAYLGIERDIYTSVSGAALVLVLALSAALLADKTSRQYKALAWVAAAFVAFLVMLGSLDLGTSVYARIAWRLERRPPSTESNLSRAASNEDRSAWGILHFSEDSLAELSKWIQRAPLVPGASPEASFIRARAHHQLGEFKLAAIEYERARSIPSAAYLQGLAVMSLKDHAKALGIFERILQEDPTHLGALYHAGVCLMNDGKYERAREGFQRFVTLRPEVLGAHYNIGVCSMELQDYSEALRSFEFVLDSNPIFVRAVLNKGFALFQLGRKRESLDAIKAALEMNPRFANRVERYQSGLLRADPVIGAAIKELTDREYAR